MAYENTVSDHYSHGNLLDAIQAAVIKLGKTIDTVTIDDLASVDEFHIGGRIATNNLLDQLNFSEQDHILDIGCGLGGASRYIANRLQNRVTGIDLTPEYIDVGKTLCTWVGLEQRVDLQQGSALSMPFKDNTFDGAIMLHVGMNIQDKPKLFSEVYRILRPGVSFGIYDVMQTSEGRLAYPVPWATENSTCQLASPESYTQALEQAHFNIVTQNDRSEFALTFFQDMRAKAEAAGGPPALGLHTLMQESTATKIKNMIENLQAGLIAPIEIIAQKK